MRKMTDAQRTATIHNRGRNVILVRTHLMQCFSDLEPTERRFKQVRGVLLAQIRHQSKRSAHNSLVLNLRVRADIDHGTHSE